MKQAFIVISVGSALRLVLITGLVIALLILVMSTSGTSESEGAVGAPAPPVAVESQG
jgi:hypothetical protein